MFTLVSVRYSRCRFCVLLMRGAERGKSRRKPGICWEQRSKRSDEHTGQDDELTTVLVVKAVLTLP
jgi:hypothetical protein